MTWAMVPATEFAAHATRWQALHAAGAASPLLAVEFVQTLLDVFGTGREVLAIHDRSGDIDVMTILAPARFGGWHTFQPSQAPIGLWLQRGTAAPDAVLPGLLRALPGLSLVVGLTQCDPILMARPGNGLSSRTLEYIQTAHITIRGAGGFDAYWMTRGKNLRNNLKKQRNRLRQTGIGTQLDILRAPDQMAQAVADYGLLERSGWKGVGNTAVEAGNRQGDFYRALLAAFARRGAASVYRYRIGDRVAAMDLCVEGGDCIVVLKTAYDETLGPQLSPALLMREEACRSLFDEGRFARIEFYGRVMEWHLRWTAEVRTMFHVNAYRWPALARLHAPARRTREHDVDVTST